MTITDLLDSWDTQGWVYRARGRDDLAQLTEQHAQELREALANQAGASAMED